jgi:site-specific DNA-methyltransferase (adenine-specific)
MMQQIGGVTLIHGDCLDVMPTLKAGSVAFVFADLPYNSLKWVAWDALPFALDAYWPAAIKASRPNAAHIFSANMLFSCRLVASNPKMFKYDLVYQKKYTSNFMLAKKRPLTYHENILVFYGSQPTYNPQMLDERIGHGRTRNAGKAGKLYGISKAVANRESLIYPRSIIARCDNRNRQEQIHPTQKPVALLEWLIRTYTNDGDTILDPVAGSASTAIAAMRVGNRKVICIEKDPVYFEAMVKRVADERIKLGLEPM